MRSDKRSVCLPTSVLDVIVPLAGVEGDTVAAVADLAAATEVNRFGLLGAGVAATAGAFPALVTAFAPVSCFASLPAETDPAAEDAEF